MTRGRPALPAAVHQLNGNPGHRPIAEDAIVIPAGAPVPPPYLSEEARAHWDRLCNDMVTAGLLTPMDGDAFAALCEALALYVQAKDELKATGLLVKTPNGYPIANPYLAIQNRAAEDIRKYMHDFGLNPSARARLRTPGGQGALFPDDDPMEAYLRINETLSNERATPAVAAPLN